MERDFLAEYMASRDQEPRRRRRGGLAGIWDRNKNIIAPLATGVVGAIPGLGPIAAAGLGAAMRGLDRPGRGGIGLDVKQAVRGGLEGYGAGSVGKMARGGAARLLGRGATDIATDVATQSAGSQAPLPTFDSSAPTPLDRLTRPIGRVTAQPLGTMDIAQAGQNYLRDNAAAQSMVSSGASQVAGAGAGGIGRGLGSGAGSTGRGLGRGLGRVLEFIRANPEAAGLGLQAISGIIGSQAERRMREREMAEERRRAQNLAMFALPIAREVYGGR